MMKMSRSTLLVTVCAVVLALAVPVVAFAAPTYQLKWGSGGAGNSQFSNPYGICSDEDGNVYVADHGNSRVQKFSSTGAYVTQWGSGGSGNGQFASDFAIAYNEGWVYVSDQGNDRVQKFTPTGTYVRQWGTSGTGDSQFGWATGIAVDHDGYVYVVDNDLDRIQKFTQFGVFVTKWGTTGTGNGQFSSARNIAVGPDQTIWVTDQQRAQHFTNTGTYLGKVGSLGSGPGQFSEAQGVAVDARGTVYVSDWVLDRVQRFSKAGTYVDTFGSTGAGDGQFDSPGNIAIDGSGVYVTEVGNDRVQKFAVPAKVATRLGGADRYEVAVNMAKEQFPSYAGMKHVIVACGEDAAMADPLTAAGLAGVWNAPVLLTRKASLPTSTKTALTAMRTKSGPLKIHVIGGTGSVPPAIYNQIKAINTGGTMDRTDGADRYEVSVKIAARMKSELAAKGMVAPKVLIINSESPAAFYDALAVSAVSARMHMPMLAVRAKSIPGSTSAALATTWSGYVRECVPSTTYVSASVYTGTGCLSRWTTNSDRVKAAADIATKSWNSNYAFVRNTAVTNKLSDALTGGAYIGSQSGVLLYTNLSTFPTTTSTFVSTKKYETQAGWIFGGPGSVTDGVKTSYTAALNTP